MFQNLSSPSLKVWIGAPAMLAAMCGFAMAQDFTMQVANPDPLGMGSFVPSLQELDLGMEGGIKGDFGYGVGVYSVYDSNFFLTESDEESELSASFSPFVRYNSDPEGGAMCSFSATYTPVFRAYLENSDLNGVDQSGDFRMKFKGGKTSVAVFGRYSSLSATDRLTGEFVEGSVMSGGVRVERRIATRTSMFANLTGSMSDYGSSESEGAEFYTTEVGGLWAASERLSLGSSLRYTTTTSDNTGTRDAWAVLAEARYRVGERIFLSASLGPEYSSNSGTGDENGLGLTGNISANYAINERWSWSNSIVSAAVPSPNQTNFVINNVSVSSSLQRELLRGALSGGLDYNFSNYEEVGVVTTTGGNENNLSLFLGYDRPLFSDRVSFNSEIRYSLNEGETDWSQIQLSARLNMAF